jgi:Holliday junction resolvasome RuvABC DNA-binding subunit
MALVTLGFPKIAAERALEKAIRQQGASSDQLDLLIKAALKNF